VGSVTPESVLPIELNMFARSFPRAWAPTAIARATKTISIAFATNSVRGREEGPFVSALANGIRGPTSSPTNARPFGSHAGSSRSRSSTRSQTCSSFVAFPSISVPIMARVSSPRQ
jgi:hypothetical protein